MIFHRRTGQREAGLGLNALDRARAHRRGIFDLLRLVQYAEAEADLLQPFDVAANLRIRGDEHVHLFNIFCLLASIVLAAGKHHGAHVRRELLNFRLPVVDQRGRRDHKARHAALRLISPLNQRQHLDGLAQTHVVRQNAAHAQPSQRLEPGKAALLIGAQTLDGRFALVRVTDRFGQRRDGGVLLDVQLGGCHQLGEVDRAAAHHVYHAALDLAYLVQIACQLRPAVVRQQRQERAVRQAHELLLFAQRLQYAVVFLRVHTVEHELKLQKISARRHPQLAAGTRAPRAHPQQTFGTIDLRCRLQQRHAFLKKIIDGVAACQVGFG